MISLKHIVLIGFLCSLIKLTFSEEVIVTIPNGAIRGKLAYSSLNNTFYSFQEIPFAKPPIGELRFASPQPAEPWDDILNATEPGRKICYQQKYSDVYEGLETEDCLYLNVYTPKHPDENCSLTVMVYIYGGGFVEGYSIFNLYGPHYFMENDVIIVTFNYRVGPLGFLTTGDLVIPGNYGLKDQNFALKWVQDNIKYFGGDPNKVTIFGLSAGGASVTYQLMSNKSTGLFRAAIAQSGSVLSPWSYQHEYLKYGYGLATYLNKSVSSSQELLDFLREVSADELKEAHASYQEEIGNVQILQGFWFTPVVEVEHEDAFLTENMYAAVENGHMNRVPLMIGICSEELIWYATGDLNYVTLLSQTYDNNTSLLVNKNMHITDEDKKDEVGREIIRIYTNGSLVDYPAGTIRYSSDTGFSRGIIRHAELQSQFSEVYFYQFSYHGIQGGNNIQYIEGAERVGHGEDNAYLWVVNNNSNFQEWDAGDQLTSIRYRTLMTNFAKTLNPTPEETEVLNNVIWPTVQPNNFLYLNINDSLSIEKDPKKDVYLKWVELYEENTVKPYDTF